MPNDGEQAAATSFFLGDSPIQGVAEDKLGQARFAEAIAEQVATAPARVGFAVGLTGAWGSGKTSLLRMIQEVLEKRSDVVVLHFNPWLFSGTEQLVTRFFSELITALAGDHDERIRSLAARIEKYGEQVAAMEFVPGIGAYVKVAKPLSLLTATLLRRRTEFQGKTVDQQRREIDGVLHGLDRRPIIAIDDIDRLSASEIRDVMRLVRLVADFPQTVYLLAFDRNRVEESLDDGVQGKGRDYLAKIMQVTYDVPLAREPDLARVLLSELQRLIDEQVTGPFNVADWQNISTLVIRPLFMTLRDIRRFLNVLPVALQVMGNEVALTDVLTLEAVRVQCPTTYAMLPSFQGILTNPKNEGEAEQAKKLLETLCASAGERAVTVRAMLRWLFPVTRRYTENYHYGADWLRRWRRERRIAHPDVFRFYFEKSLPNGMVDTSTVEALFNALGDRDRLNDR